MQTSTYELNTLFPNAHNQIHIDCKLKSLSIDSRDISSPEETLFIAFNGSSYTVENYIDSVINQSPCCIIIEEKYKDSVQWKNQNVIFVEDTKIALQEIVISQRQKYSLDTIAITGSNGKTIVKEWLSQLLIEEYNLVKNPKSYNSQVGVPLSVWGLEEEHNLGIFEAGISRTGEMSKLEKIIQPNIGILTTIGDAHNDGFENYEEKLNEKLALFVNCKSLILPSHLLEQYQSIFDAFSKEKNCDISYFTWGEESSDVIFSENANDELEVRYDDKYYTLSISDYSKIYLHNLKTVIATICFLEKAEKTLKNGISLSPLDMRMEIVKGIYNTTLINDTYNYDIQSLEIALNYLQKNNATHKSIIISSIDSKTNKDSEVIELLKNANNISNIFFIGEFSDTFKKEMTGCLSFISYYNTVDECINSIDPTTLDSHTILVKGSRKLQLEKVIERYKEKNHNTFLKVNLNTIGRNYKYFKSLVPNNVKTMVMLKAFGYGIGSVELAKYFKKLRVDYIAVAFIDEAVEIRKSGVDTPIMVIHPDYNLFRLLISYNIEPEVFSLHQLKELLDYLKDTTLAQIVNVHLKIDTGMNRLGMIESEIDEALSLVQSSDKIKVKSILSHLSSADKEEAKAFTLSQIDLFKKLSTHIEDTLGYKIDKHILNTAGVINYFEYSFDMIRMGVGLMGYDPSENHNELLQSPLTLVSHISQIKKAKKGSVIGYGQGTILKEDKIIAILHIGYADGYNRLLGNGNAEVFVNGEKAKTLGNISMDLSIIDITNIPDAKVGDEVELIGEHISLLGIAKKLKTIPYEVMTSISNRVQRVYIEE